MRKLKIFLPVCFCSIFFTACMNISYDGSSYPPTTGVKMYRNPKKIKHAYAVMGKCVMNVDYSDYTQERMIKSIVRKAESEGADAVILDEYEIVPTGKKVRESQLDNCAQSMTNNLDTNSDAGWSWLGQNFNYDYGTIGQKSDGEHPTYRRIMRTRFVKFTHDAPSAVSKQAVPASGK